MKWMLSIAVVVISLASLLVAKPQAEAQAPNQGRFMPVSIIVDTGDKALAAYQIDFKPTAGAVKIVGIAAGEHQAFASPPYYDPGAIQHEQVIIGAFSTDPAEQLPTGATRVATVTVYVTGDQEPRYTVKLTACATVGGERIAGKVLIRKGNTP